VNCRQVPASLPAAHKAKLHDLVDSKTTGRKAIDGEAMKKKISIIGLVLGAMVGVIAGLLAGGWLMWLGLGLAIGLLIGSASARREQGRHGNIQAGNLSS
jgi:F0F1-type ATP synthase assembly protein I